MEGCELASHVENEIRVKKLSRETESLSTHYIFRFFDRTKGTVSWLAYHRKPSFRVIYVWFSLQKDVIVFDFQHIKVYIRSLRIFCRKRG